jgi:hypothetical protein
MAVGARLTLSGDGLATQTAEVSAGSGYLGQSSPTVFFGLGTQRTQTGDSPWQLSVRWPDGSTSVHSVPQDVRRVLLP